MSSENIPEGIKRTHVVKAIEALDTGTEHNFADSTKYDVLYKDKRYAPKAVLGIAASFSVNKKREFGPYDFKGGDSSKCFRVLRSLGFDVVRKPGFVERDNEIYADEAEDVQHYEGAGKKVTVNKYERNIKARKACLKKFGYVCKACDLPMTDRYGNLGKEFVHVHHIVPLSDIGKRYRVKGETDLMPVCPNCHAMLHRQKPPLTVGELREIIKNNE